jgi:hypothetical protein
MKLFGKKKRRKYPIKYDEEGRSARRRCFELFPQKVPLPEIAKTVGIDIKTVYRYFRQWKQLGVNFERRYSYVQSIFDKKAPDRDKNIELFAGVCGISTEQFETILLKPHGLRRLITGKYHFPAHEEADLKRRIALELAILMSDFLIKQRGKLEDIYFALKRYLYEAMKYRQEEDADTKNWNQWMSLVHKILAAEIENERKGRVKPDTFSEEERNAIVRLGLEKEKKNIEIMYLFRIGVLMAGGSTEKEARNQIYQEEFKKGDLKKIKILQELQNRVHPLKMDSNVPSIPPDQPPSLP